jgi:signal transduction histidine kinase
MVETAMRFQYKLLITFAIFLSVAIGSTFYFFNRVEHRLLDRIDKDFEQVIKSVHFSTARLSSEKSADQNVLSSFIQEATQNKSVREITIINKDEQVVASSNPKNIGSKRRVTGREMIVREEFGSVSDSKNQNRYVINIPIIRDGKPIGLVQTSIVLHDFSKLFREYSFEAIITASCAFVGILLFSTIVLLRLSKPLRMLTGAARSVSEGDLSATLPPASKDEIGQLNEAFSTMVQKLGEQKKTEEKLAALQRQAILSETAAIFSHEIRNPLNLINLTADHLVHTYEKSSSVNDAGDFATIANNLKAQIRQLNGMVEEFIAIGKPSRLSKVIFKFDDLIKQIEILIKSHLIEKKISLIRKYPPDQTVYGDLEQLQLVFLNLLINAVELLPAGGRIVLNARREGSGMVLSVTDNGPGIAEEDLLKIFEPYFSRRPGGTGLGLTLARRIVEQHGGRIQAESRERTGGGAYFEILLPEEVDQDGPNSHR